MPKLNPTLAVRRLTPQAVPAPGTLPEFVPLPDQRSVEFYSGLSRGMLNQLVLPCKANQFNPPVKSVSLRRAGSRRGPSPGRGRRLIVLASLLEYLRGKLAEQTNASASTQPDQPSASTASR